MILDLLGIPRSGRPYIKASAEAINEFVATLVFSVTENWQRLAGVFADVSAYLKSLIAERRKHPGEDLLTRMVMAEENGDMLSEELLRYVSPVHTLARRTMGEVTMRGVSIPKDSSIYLLVGAANRDPEKFPDPEKLDINRPSVRSLGFGYGIHFCIGATLARMESQVAFHSLLRRLTHLKLAGETPEFRPNYSLRGLISLPVEFRQAPG